jgi:hypothetical protein
VSSNFSPGSTDWIKAEQAKVTSGAGKAAGISVGKWLGIGCGIPVALVLVIVLAVSLSGNDSSPSTVVADKYVQTWNQSYSETDCAEWNDVMTPAQQFAAAADILTSARNKIDGGVGLPPDSLISEFEAGITRVCVVPELPLTDATFGLYSTEPRFRP